MVHDSEHLRAGEFLLGESVYRLRPCAIAECHGVRVGNIALIVFPELVFVNKVLPCKSVAFMEQAPSP
jgi:hypothetical protein